MYKIISLLAALLLCFSFCASAEGTDKTAQIRLSSFAGGGFEYTARTEDPSILSCEARYVYEENAENLCGASFDYIVTLTGLKPGTTMVSIFGRSPNLGNETRLYTAAVDENCRVTLTPLRAISTLFVSRVGEINYSNYTLVLGEDGYRLSVNDGEGKTVSQELADELMAILDRYDVQSWDGFSESPKGFAVLDGEEFWLEIEFTDGTRMRARGENVFPTNYGEAMGNMWRILMWMEEDL